MKSFYTLLLTLVLIGSNFLYGMYPPKFKQGDICRVTQGEQQGSEVVIKGDSLTVWDVADIWNAKEKFRLPAIFAYACQCIKMLGKNEEGRQALIKIVENNDPSEVKILIKDTIYDTKVVYYGKIDHIGYCLNECWLEKMDRD